MHPLETSLAEVPAVGSDIVSVEEPDMHPLETSLAEVPAVGSNVVSVEEPDMHPSETSVTVSLNENRAGGRLSGTDVLCGTISTLGSDRGWVKISAEASDERKVEGWLHEVYATMLASKCGTSTPPA